MRWSRPAAFGLLNPPRRVHSRGVGAHVHPELSPAIACRIEGPAHEQQRVEPRPDQVAGSEACRRACAIRRSHGLYAVHRHFAHAAQRAHRACRRRRRRARWMDDPMAHCHAGRVSRRRSSPSVISSRRPGAMAPPSSRFFATPACARPAVLHPRLENPRSPRPPLVRLFQAMADASAIEPELRSSQMRIVLSFVLRISRDCPPSPRNRHGLDNSVTACAARHMGDRERK